MTQEEFTQGTFSRIDTDADTYVSEDEYGAATSIFGQAGGMDADMDMDTDTDTDTDEDNDSD